MSTKAEIILKDVIVKAYDHLYFAQQAAKKIQDEAKPEDTNAQINLRFLALVLNSINDIIHPAHDISKELFVKNIDGFVDDLKKLYQQSVDNKLFPPCICESCPKKVNDEIKDEDWIVKREPK